MAHVPSPGSAGRGPATSCSWGRLDLELDADAQALADDAQRLQQWQQAAQAQGLELARASDGRLRVSGGDR